MVGHILASAKRAIVEVGRYRIDVQIDNYVLVLGHTIVGVVVFGEVLVEILRPYFEMVYLA